MLKYFIEKLNKIFNSGIDKNLEEYIIAGNPRNADDIDRLQREYLQRNSSTFL